MEILAEYEEIPDDLKKYFEPATVFPDVWPISTQPFSGAHFATFPEELVRRCLFAGTSEKGCCPKCGGPWVRVIERPSCQPDSWKGSKFDDGKNLEIHPNVGRREDAHSETAYPKGSTANRLALLRQQARANGGEYQSETKTLGWRPSCNCREERTARAIVFDPFFGAGTVGVVAQKYNRRYIGLELKLEYCQMARKRVNSQPVAML